MNRISLTLLGIIISMTSFSQEYSHGLGLQYNYGIFREAYTTDYVDYSGVVGVAVPGVVYKANLGFDISRDFHVSATAYPFLGFYLNTQTGGYLGAELPVLCELYFGDMDDFGGFFGAGGTMAFLGSSDSGGGAIVGPQAVGGLQFPLRDRMVALKIGYTYGLNKRDESVGITYSVDKRSMLSFGLLYKFD